MDKKGFTLIELLISISLLSVVLIFMMNTLVKLRDTDIANGIETNLLVGQAIITKTISSDVLEKGGIGSYSGCNTNSNIINLNLKDGARRTIELNTVETPNLEPYTVLTYKSDIDTKAILIRKTPRNFYYDGFECKEVGNLTKIVIKIKNSDEESLPKYYSEVLYYAD